MNLLNLAFVLLLVMPACGLLATFSACVMFTMPIVFAATFTTFFLSIALVAIVSKRVERSL